MPSLEALEKVNDIISFGASGFAASGGFIFGSFFRGFFFGLGVTDGLSVYTYSGKGKIYAYM